MSIRQLHLRQQEKLIWAVVITCFVGGFLLGVAVPL